MKPQFSAIQESVERYAAAWIDAAPFGKHSRDDAASAPKGGGVYVFRRAKDKKPVYVGESSSLRSRLLQRYVKKEESTLTRAIRRQLSLPDAAIEVIRKVLTRDYEFDYLSIPFGRREIEAFLQKKLKTKQPNQALEHNDPSRHASCCAPVAPPGIVAHL